MGNIFSTVNNETLIIYPHNNVIYLLITNNTSPCQAKILEEDYKSSFSSFLYNQTIYYTYINNRGELVAKNIRDRAAVLTLPVEDDTAPYKEALAEAEMKVASLKKTVADLQEENAALQKAINSMEQAIESAKKQYATLMETATKYREEAFKWYGIAKGHKK